MSQDMNLTHAVPEKSAPLRVPGQVINPAGRCGPCDPAFRDSEHVLKHFRYATAYFTFVNAAGVLTMPATARELFTAGIGQDGADAGFSGNLGLVQTDAGKDGAVVGKEESFTIYGISMRARTPFARAGGTITQSDAHDAYIPLLQALLLENVAVTALFGDDEKEQHLGTPAHWGDTSGPVGAGLVANGQYTNGVFLPFYAGALTGGAGEDNQITIRLTPDAIISAEARAVVATSDLIIPIEVRLWGEMSCADDVEACAAESDAKLAAKIRRMRAQGLI